MQIFRSAASLQACSRLKNHISETVRGGEICFTYTKISTSQLFRTILKTHFICLFLSFVRSQKITFHINSPTFESIFLQRQRVLESFQMFAKLLQGPGLFIYSLVNAYFCKYLHTWILSDIGLKDSES